MTCPAGTVAPLRDLRDEQIARFAKACRSCPLAHKCTSSPKGRTIHVGPHELLLARARERQADPRLEGRLHRHAPKGRAQDRAPGPDFLGAAR